MKSLATVGMDLGDKFHTFFTFDETGQPVQQERIPATARALERRYATMPPACVAIEAGTHSPWVSRMLEEWGHEVLVGNPRKLRMRYNSNEKNDDRDAEMLARMARFDPQLLSPIRHRGQQAQAHLAIIKSRDTLVKARAQLINHARGLVKAIGERLPSCSAEAFHRKVADSVPKDLQAALFPIIKTIGELTEKIQGYDGKIASLSERQYPETNRLRQVKGVGPITALAFVLTLENPHRFGKSRSVPVYLGLTPRRAQAGEVDKQLRITKAGDEDLRRLLVTSAHYILGPFGPDCALRKWGLELAQRGGKNAKKRAIVAVARKLAVVLHRLWITGETYKPFPEPSPHRKRKKQKQRITKRVGQCV